MKFLTRILVVLIISSFIISCGSEKDSKVSDINENQKNQESSVETTPSSAESLINDGFLERFASWAKRGHILKESIVMYCKNQFFYGRTIAKRESELKYRLEKLIEEAKQLFVDYQKRMSFIDDLDKNIASTFYYWQKCLEKANIETEFKNLSYASLDVSQLKKINSDLSSIHWYISTVEEFYIEDQFKVIMNFWKKNKILETAEKLDKNNSSVDRQAFIASMNAHYKKIKASATYAKKFANHYAKSLEDKDFQKQSSKFGAFNMSVSILQLALKPLTGNETELNKQLKEVIRALEIFVKYFDELPIYMY